MNAPAEKQPALNIGDVVAKYIELRDKQTTIMERHKEELKPIQEGMGAIEKYMLNYMEAAGIDSIKTPSGTPYKHISRSVKMQDSSLFKEYVFKDVILTISSMLGKDSELLVKNALLEGTKWDMVDFRAGKKGIVEHFENTQEVVPGVEFSQFTTVNIRRK